MCIRDSVKALNQFEYAGVIKRVSKGRYYKHRTSRFGELLPPEKEIVRDFLEKDGNTIGYITGTRAFASLALTTQILSLIHISYTSDQGKTYDFNTADKLNTLLISPLLLSFSTSRTVSALLFSSVPVSYTHLNTM